jgi:hypothetical protein
LTSTQITPRVKNRLSGYPDVFVYFACLSLGLNIEQIKKSVSTKKTSKKIKAKCEEFKANESLLMQTVLQYWTGDEIAEYLSIRGQV